MLHRQSIRNKPKAALTLLVILIVLIGSASFILIEINYESYGANFAIIQQN